MDEGFIHGRNTVRFRQRSLNIPQYSVTVEEPLLIRPMVECMLPEKGGTVKAMPNVQFTTTVQLF